jgi:hypothetical protein
VARRSRESRRPVWASSRPCSAVTRSRARDARHSSSGAAAKCRW